MFFKKKPLDINGSCFDCEFGKPNPISGDVMCKYKGIVASNGICKKYKKNLLAVQPRKKRSVAGDFTPDDFSLD